VKPETLKLHIASVSSSVVSILQHKAMKKLQHPKTTNLPNEMPCGDVDKLVGLYRLMPKHHVSRLLPASIRRVNYF